MQGDEERSCEGVARVARDTLLGVSSKAIDTRASEGQWSAKRKLRLPSHKVKHASQPSRAVESLSQAG